MGVGIGEVYSRVSEEDGFDGDEQWRWMGIPLCSCVYYWGL